MGEAPQGQPHSQGQDLNNELCSLPDTQTQSSQIDWSQNTPTISHVWGKLASVSPRLEANKSSVQFDGTFTKHIELTESQFKVGRAKDCNFIVTTDITKNDLYNNISKEHFIITKDTNEPASPAILQDLSFNGTFVNGQKIGKGNKRILCSNDEISLSHPKAKLFAFEDMVVRNNDLNIPEDVLKKYFIYKEIGRGACGIVNLVYDKFTCEKFAMKIIPKKKLPIGQKTTLNDPKKIMNEVNILKSLKHPLIISTKEVLDSPNMVCIVLELMEGGELFDRVCKMGRLDERCAKIIFRQMVLAVKYLHEQGVAHRDLKPENVLLASDDPEPLVKLSDFGLSKLVGEESFMKTICGTPMYLAPEVLLAEGISTYGQQVDVWSLGVILFMCLSGYAPFHENYKTKSLHEQIIQGEYMLSREHWRGVSYEARRLVVKMLKVNPTKRITLDRILNDVWVNDEAVIQRVNELIENTSTDNGQQNVVNTDDREGGGIKRNLSEASQESDPPTKRIKLSDQDVAPATPSTSNSSNDTVEQLPIESLSCN